jgi:hypothetical protein
MSKPVLVCAGTGPWWSVLRGGSAGDGTAVTQHNRAAGVAQVVGAFRQLLAAGLRIEGPPMLYCATWPGPPYQRIVPTGLALP